MMGISEAQIAFEQYKLYKQDLVRNQEKLQKLNFIKITYHFTKILLKIITFFSGEKIECLGEKNMIIPANKTVIWANTHRFKPDFEKITIVTKRPSTIIASDFCGSYKNISGWYFNTRGAIFVDPYSKEDKKISYELMKMYLIQGLDCMIFPEAVWNLSENLIVLDTFYGTVKAALETDSLLICTAIERYGRRYVINRSKVIDLNNIAKKISDIPYKELDVNDANQKKIQKSILQKSNMLLRDTMATLLYEIWENEAKDKGLTKRESLPDNYWENFLEGLVREWPAYKMSDNVEQRFQNSKVLEQQQVENDLIKLRRK